MALIITHDIETLHMKSEMVYDKQTVKLNINSILQ